jgi:phage-related protein
MAIGLAFVDIVGDTSRTEAQVERDMNRVLAVVEDSIDPVEIQGAVDAGTERALTNEMNQDIRAAQAAISEIQVRADLDPETRARLEASLKTTIAELRRRRAELQVRVDNRPIIEDTVEAVVEAVHIAEAAAPAIELETRVDNDRIERDLAGLASAAGSALGSVTQLAVGLGSLGGTVGAVSAVAAALADIAPAAALGATAILGVASVIGTIKLATAGISDAVKAAFDPSDPKKYAEALKNISPQAQKFVGVLAEMRPQLKAFQQSIQDTVFSGLSTNLKEAGGTLLPIFKDQLTKTGMTLNTVAKSILDTGGALGASGVLGQALTSANKGLTNLVGLPAQFGAGLVTIAAAAGPAFDKLTGKIAGGADKISAKLQASFESGGLQKAIDGAVAQLGSLFRALGNIGHALGNVNDVAKQFAGAGLFSTLESVTKVLAKATETSAFTDALKALLTTADALGKQVFPLLAQALGAVLPVITALAPGAQALIGVLGPALTQIVSALAPVLLAAGNAVSAVVIALSPMITLLGTLISTVLPVLTPLLDAVVIIFGQMVPVINTLASMFTSTFVPILNVLISAVLPPLVSILTTITGAVLPVFQQLLVALQPAISTLSTAFVTLVTALAPLLQALASLIEPLLAPLLKIITPIIETVGKLAAIFADELAHVITTIVVPALMVITSFINGDFHQAWDSLKDLVKGVIAEIVRLLSELPFKIIGALGDLGITLLRIFKDAFIQLNMELGVKILDLKDNFHKIPGIIVDALGDLSALLVNAGKQIISGLISGIKSSLGGLGSVLGGVTDFVKEHKGPPERDAILLEPAGRSIMQSLINGIMMERGSLGAELASITAMVSGTSMSLGSVGAGGFSGGGGTSAAAAFAGTNSLQPVAAQVPHVTVIVGDRELNDIIDVRVSGMESIAAGRISNGMRF